MSVTGPVQSRYREKKWYCDTSRTQYNKNGICWALGTFYGTNALTGLRSEGNIES